MNHFYPNEDALMDGAFFNNLPRAVDEFDSVEDQLACGKEPVLASHHSGVGRSNQIVFWGFMAALMIYELLRGIFFVAGSC